MDTPRPRAGSLALVCAPWHTIRMPSLQCGILSAHVAAEGHRVESHHFNLDFAPLVGIDLYEAVANSAFGPRSLIGEWLFGQAAFGDDTPGPDGLMKQEEVSSMLGSAGVDVDRLLRLRAEIVPAWVRETVATVDWARYDLIGFSSTFEQNCASIALATEINRIAPGTPCVFGGANVLLPMGLELLRTVPAIDYIVCGEGEIALTRLLEATVAGNNDAVIPGVYSSATDPRALAGTQTEQLKSLDDVPVPDYADYFEALERMQARVPGFPTPRSLFMESSRGCWWGEKHHCTFCGLPDFAMKFRSKSAERVADELSELSARHKVISFLVVDNILNMRHVDEVFGTLSHRPIDLSLFYEVKANLRPDQMALLRRGGVTGVQPGIESLSTHVLSLMKKGSDLMTNLTFLKWGTYFRFDIEWNILFGFPGETVADYQSQTELMPALWHLPPPRGAGPLWMERYSPLFERGDPSLTAVRPAPAYALVYPPSVDPSRIAYFFDYDTAGLANDAVAKDLMNRVAAWRSAWEVEPSRRPSFQFRRGSNFVLLADSRTGEERRAVLSGWQAEVFLAANVRAKNAARILSALTDKGHDISAAQLDRFLDRCVELMVMAEDGGRYLSLAVPARFPTAELRPRPG